MPDQVNTKISNDEYENLISQTLGEKIFKDKAKNRQFFKQSDWN